MSDSHPASMVEEKYIGLALAVAGSVAIGTSFIITKKGLNDAGSRDAAYASASDNLSYLRNPIWWAGMSTMVIGEVANFAAYTFAPPILVTPLGALSVLIGAVLASFLLNEELGHLGRLGCALCLIGSLIIVLHAPEDKEVQTVDEILHYAIQPGFLLYCFTVVVFTLVIVYAVAPRYGRTNPNVYISICSLVGSVSIMAIKGFGVAVKLTFGGNNQFTHPSTYVFGIVLAFCILVQVHYFNKALDTFDTNVVNPLYYVGFSSATIVASLILFQGFNTTDTTNTVSLLAGFAVTFMGVHLLNFSRTQSDSLPVAQNGRDSLEGRPFNPRSGRRSHDTWNGDAETGDVALHADGRAGHARRSSAYRTHGPPIFDAFTEEEERETESVGLRKMRDEGEIDDDDEGDGADERTHLRSNTARRGHRVVPRSHHHSPNTTPQGDGNRGPSI